MNDVERCLLLGWANGFKASSTFDSTKPCTHFQAAVTVITMDTDMDTSLRDRLGRKRISNNVVRRGQTALTSFNIRETKRNVEWLLKRSLDVLKLTQHRFNFDSTCSKWGGGGGKQTVLTSLLNKIERTLKQMVKPFAQALSDNQEPVARSLVSGNRWLRGIKTYRFPWDSANHPSSNRGQNGREFEPFPQK